VTISDNKNDLVTSLELALGYFFFLLSKYTLKLIAQQKANKI